MSSNPFEISDDECSSGDEITKIFESDDDGFDFEKWLEENKLTDIKQCFHDHDMTTLDTLNMNNTNFSKLMADQRILAKVHLVPSIVSSIQSLQILQIQQEKTKQNDEEKEGTSDTTTKSTKRLIFMTEIENQTFQNMHQYIENLKNLQNELKIVTYQDFEITRDKNNEQIEKYETMHLNDLDKISDKIHSKFEELHEILNKKTKILHGTINDYQQEICDIVTSHDILKDKIDNKYKNGLKMIDEDKKQCTDSIVKCKNIIKKYDDESIDDDIKNNEFSFKSINKKRENEIIETGDITKTYYEKRQILLDDDQEEIEKYTKSQLDLTENDVYSIKVYNKIYNQIINDLNQLIDINDTTKQKQQSQLIIKKNIEQKEDLDVIGDDEKEKKQININNDDDMFDEIYCIEFTQKPFGLTFGTNMNEKNLFVTTINENSIAFKKNVIIGSKIIKLQNENVENLGSTKIYKIFNNKYGNILPLKITFKKPSKNNIDNDNDIISRKFDRNWCCLEKWELSSDNKIIQGIDYDPFTAYCVYFENNGYDEGIHFITVKCERLKIDDDNNVKCCIGITSEKRKDWIMNGINDSWPKIGVYSFFDGWAEDPYWYSNETITVKLDINNLMVYYFNVDKTKKTLIKKQKINKAKKYYFMMCADSDPSVRYSIK